MSMSIHHTQGRSAFPALEATDRGATPVAGHPTGAGKADLFEQLAQAHAKMLGTPSASQGLPPPDGRPLAPATLTRLEALNATQVSADIYTFMALFQKIAQQMRNTARTQRTVDMQAQVTSLQGAAAEMRSAANWRLGAAIVQGGAQIVGGSAQVWFALKAGQGPAENIEKTIGYGKSVNELFTGSGGVIGSFLTHEADHHDARRAELDAQARGFETGVQHANDTMQQMMDVIRDVRDKLQAIQQSAVDTNRSIARNI